MSLMQVVLKVSKLCNLRCRYCYEFEQLGNSKRMSQSDLRQHFVRLRAMGEREAGVTRLEIIWHGGEPTLLPASHFVDAIAYQRQVFEGSRIQATHAIQTNLFRLPPKMLELLSGPLFAKVGISVDVFGGLRVDMGGRDSNERVVSNLDELRQARPNVGAVVVLSRDNMNALPEIVHFFEDRSMPYRISPIYRSAYGGQNDSRALSRDELVRVHCWLVERWLAGPQVPRSEPAAGFVATALRVIARRTRSKNALQRRDRLLIVDTDSSIYYQADAYDPTFNHDSLFAEPDANPRGKHASNAEAVKRMQRHCATCEFFGPCDGFPVVEATPDERALFPQVEGSRCPVAYPVIRFTVNLLRQNLESQLAVA